MPYFLSPCGPQLSCTSAQCESLSQPRHQTRLERQERITGEWTGISYRVLPAGRTPSSAGPLRPIICKVLRSSSVHEKMRFISVRSKGGTTSSQSLIMLALASNRMRPTTSTPLGSCVSSELVRQNAGIRIVSLTHFSYSPFVLAPSHTK